MFHDGVKCLPKPITSCSDLPTNIPTYPPTHLPTNRLVNVLATCLFTISAPTTRRSTHVLTTTARAKLKVSKRCHEGKTRAALQTS